MNQKKVASLSFEVIRNVSIMLVVVNLMVIVNIAYWVTYSTEKSEKSNMQEVILRLSGEMNSELQRYIDATMGISVNSVVQQYLEVDNTVGTTTNISPQGQSALDELGIIANLFSDVVLHVAVGSVESDNILDHTGNMGGAGFSLRTTDYYSAITEQKLVITPRICRHKHWIDHYYVGFPSLLRPGGSPWFGGT